MIGAVYFEPRARCGIERHAGLLEVGLARRRAIGTIYASGGLGQVLAGRRSAPTDLDGAAVNDIGLRFACRVGLLGNPERLLDGHTINLAGRIWGARCHRDCDYGRGRGCAG